MGKIGKTLSNFVSNIVGSVLMLILAVISFFIVVFVVSAGSSLAGYQPSGDFVVLSSAIITASATLSGFIA